MRICTLSNFVIFTIGAVVGSVATWKVIERRFEQLRDKYLGDVEEEQEDVIVAEAKPVKVEYEEIAKQYSIEKEEPKKMMDEDLPFIIAPEEAGQKWGQKSIVSWTLYSCGTLVDEFYDLVDDESKMNTIGLDSLNHFGEYEDDSVFVRNNRLKTDYEILLDEETYASWKKRIRDQRLR